MLRTDMLSQNTNAVVHHARVFTSLTLLHLSQSWWICYPFYSAVMIASKLSIGYFLLRVSVRRLHIWILYITMSVTLCAGLAFFVGSFLQCRPLSYWWTRYREPEGGSCIDPTIIIVLAYIYSVFAIASDAMMALFPVLLISALNMNRQLKMMLIPLMAMGTMYVVILLPFGSLTCPGGLGRVSC